MTSALGLTTYGTKALLITDLSVVRNAGRTSDPCNAPAGAEDRVWTIGHMLKVEAARQAKTPNQYVSAWLDAWTTPTTVNGQTFPTSNVSGPLVKANWPKDGFGNYLLHKAPFKLLAIVNRLDLRAVRPGGEPLGGEIRFVFAPQYNTNSVNPPLPPPDCLTHADEASTIILEYSPAKASENAVVDWAKKWHALGSMSFGSDYRIALAALTEELLTSGRLLRIRTNEAPNGVVWTFTEFDHDPVTKVLRRTTIKRSPTDALHEGNLIPPNPNNSVMLGQWIASERSAIQGTKPVGRTFLGNPIRNYFMPDTFPGVSPAVYLRGGFTQLDNTKPFSFFWGAANPGLFQGEWDELRHLFSLATCNGCHGRETNTGLLHIRSLDSAAAALSDFLAGPVTVPDPMTGQNRQFDEMGRREEDLKALVADGYVGVPVVKNAYPGGQDAAMNYKMVFWHSGKCIGVENASQSNNALVKQYTCTGNGSQRLALVEKGQAVYNLVFKHSGKCLDVENSSTATNARMVQRTCNDATSQRIVMWFASPEPGFRNLMFEHSSKCLRVLNNSTSGGAQVVQDTCTQSNDRSFKFVE